MKKRAGTQAVAPPRPMTRRQLSRHQRELRQRRLIFGITGAVVGLILLIFAVGFYREFVGKGDEPVARVGDTAISGRTMAKAIGYYRSLYALHLSDAEQAIAENQPGAETDEAKKKLLDAATQRLQLLSSMLQSADSVALETLVDGEVLRQDAARRGITLSQADRDRALVSEMDPERTQLQPEPQPLPAQPSAETVAAAQARLPQVLQDGRVLSEDDFNRLILEPTAFRLKVEDETSATVPATGEQVHAQHILVDSEDSAKEVLALINQGSLDFAATAKQMSLDTSNKDEGGDLGWFPKGVMDPDFEQAAFALEPGQTSEPVQTQFGYHIIKVLEKDSDRPLESQMLLGLRAQALQKRINDLKADELSPVKYELDAAKVKWVNDNAPQPAPPTASS